MREIVAAIFAFAPSSIAGGYEIRDQDGRIHYQCVFLLDSCRWIRIN
jgi:hypothetical protein